MPAASAGNVLFSKLVAFKEATYGTIPTLTSGGRKLLVQPTGVISDGVTIELGTERSVALRNPLIGSTGTITAIEPTLSATVPAVSIGELPIWLSMTRGTAAAGTASPYTWDFDYSQTAANAPQSYTLVATDGIQQYAVNYSLAESITIAADRNGLTNLSASLFAQNVAKNSATLAEGTPTSPFLSGRLWNAYQHGSSFPGTADGTAYEYLLDFSLEFNAGITRQSYLAGTSTFSTHAESAPFSGTLTLTVSSTASAVSTWYDAYRAATPKGVRLTWSNGTYSAHILAYIVPTEVQQLAGAEDGLTTMAVTGTLVYDTASAKSLRIVVNSDLSALP
tara:strand:+ start:7870 stop:8877 length:1008 start_codon:yes stop_codon:yes gene_type:complete